MNYIKKANNNVLGGGALSLDKKQRTDLYDWIRLIATILVIIGHSMYTSLHTGYGGVDYTLPQNINSIYFHPVIQKINYLAGWVYSYHMPLFFLLSGAVLGLRPVEKLDIFIKKKIQRLLVPYFLVGWLFMLPVKYVSSFYTKEGFLSAMNMFLVGGDSGHLWFLPALFWCTLVFVLLQKLLMRFGINSVYLLLGISGVISLRYTSLPFDFFILKEGLRYLFWFALGYVFESERKNAEKWNNIKLVYVCMVANLITFVHTQYGVLPSFYVVLLGCVRIVVISAICTRAFSGFWESTTGKLISRNLFNVYLFHDPLEYVILKIFFSGTLLTTKFGCISYFLARLVLVVILSICIGEIIRFICVLSKQYLKS